MKTICWLVVLVLIANAEAGKKMKKCKADNTPLIAENEALAAEKDKLTAEKAALTSEKATLTAEKECLAADKAELAAELAQCKEAKVCKYDKLDGLVDFWPLTKKYEGSNLVNPAAGLTMNEVTYEGVAVNNIWESPAVSFTGKANSYADILNNDYIQQKRSFSILASVYRRATRDGPIFEWDNGSSIGTHIWIFRNKFYVNVYFDSCPYQNMFFSDVVQNNHWYTLAVSFDAEARKIIMTVNGESVEKDTPVCNSDLKKGNSGHINRRLNNNTHRINGYITCMSIYEKALSYDQMYQATMPFCKGCN